MNFKHHLSTLLLIALSSTALMAHQIVSFGRPSTIIPRPSANISRSAPITATSSNIPGQRWSADRANVWYAAHKWISGSDYIPRTAINQLEMWQKETFDPMTIDQELGWAQSIGFNTMRVFLHSVAWKEDPHGFKDRVNKYLAIADKHHIQTIFVFFDDCWNKVPHAGIQPTPRPGIHNSGWIQDPGQPASADPANFPGLKPYVQDVLTTFKDDRRILLWDLYNEPGNSGKRETSLPLLANIFTWAREINPSQPISAGIWAWDLETLNQFQVSHSDVITYHDYTPVEEHLKTIQFLKMTGRPVICTEYMARPRNSRFETIMPMLKKEHVGAINWGLVSGKTNTIYAWDTPMPDGAEPKEWFHEVFHKDGKPYRSEETDLIRKLNTER